MEIGEDFPFIPKRIFTIKPSKTASARGNHAHKECQQFILLTCGSCKLEVISNENRSEYLLESGKFGIYVPPLNWVSLSNFSDDCCILVLASLEYDPKDYIYDLNIILETLPNL